MKYWKEATNEEYEYAPSRVIDNRTGKKYIVVEQGELKDIISDILEEIKYYIIGLK